MAKPEATDRERSAYAVLCAVLGFIEKGLRVHGRTRKFIRQQLPARVFQKYIFLFLQKVLIVLLWELIHNYVS